MLAVGVGLAEDCTGYEHSPWVRDQEDEGMERGCVHVCLGHVCYNASGISPSQGHHPLEGSRRVRVSMCFRHPNG